MVFQTIDGAVFRTIVVLFFGCLVFRTFVFPNVRISGGSNRGTTRADPFGRHVTDERVSGLPEQSLARAALLDEACFFQSARRLHNRLSIEISFKSDGLYGRPTLNGLLTDHPFSKAFQNGLLRRRLGSLAESPMKRGDTHGAALVLCFDRTALRDLGQVDLGTVINVRSQLPRRNPCRLAKLPDAVFWNLPPTPPTIKNLRRHRVRGVGIGQAATKCRVCACRRDRLYKRIHYGLHKVCTRKVYRNINYACASRLFDCILVT